MEKAYNYSDIYLVPKYSELKSRSEADISVEFLGRKFKAPWLPANMSSVIDEKIAHWLSENDYFYIMHRFGDNMAFIRNTNKFKWKLISISVGVKEKDYELIEWLSHDTNNIVHFVTIDVANGHSILVKDMIEHIRIHLPNVKIIAGNVCTSAAVRDLADWGADAVKCGIAGGGSCSTKNMTGFHVPMFSCIEKCESRPFIDDFGSSWKDIPIIADGGIRENGDIAKALVAGADLVMAGSLFAACVDAPGENLYKDSRQFGIATEDNRPPTHKKYFGSASVKQKGSRIHVEGFETELQCNGLTYLEKYQELTESLKSAISYAGGKDLTAFNTVDFVTIK